MADAWRVILARDPKELLARVPADMLRRVLGVLHALEQNPRPAGRRKLRGYDNLYRVRLGEWRITYAVEDDRLIVLVIEVARR